MKTKIAKTTAADRIYNNAISALVKKTSQWGYTVELAKQFSRLVGKPIFRQTIDCWLHRDPAKRSHPDYGNVMLLLKASEATDKVFAGKKA